MSALAEALVAAQAELPLVLGKDAQGAIDGKGGTRSYRYLTLDKLIAETRPILQRHGLTIVQCPVGVGAVDSTHMPALATTLHHVEGESITWNTPLYLSDKSMQGFGAAITYARRYAWQSVLGIAAEEDTDAPAGAGRMRSTLTRSTKAARDVLVGVYGVGSGRQS